MKHLLKMEWRKAITLQKILLCLAVIFIPTSFQFFIVKTGYTFYRPVDVHAEVVGNVIALLFPLLFIVLYANSFAAERKDNFIAYTKIRARLSHYIMAKGIVNAGMVFVVAFAMVFLPFVFLVFIEPSIGLIVYESRSPGSFSSSIGTLEIFLQYGSLTYGIIFSTWIAINAVLYATAAYVLTLIIKNNFLALSLPFLWYFVMNFIASILGHPEFSTTSTVFPFNITAQPIWTILIPFSVHLLFLSILIAYVNKDYKENVYEYAD
ncbi:hypothetical protein [Salinicoccus albus]|uniref:hypothetical protein n=1 Tax=Salinicoccus albus TaxID=418756 RepID=UPI0003652DF7|nr:hypothetical protein [Salinicoccus albus]